MSLEAIGRVIFSLGLLLMSQFLNYLIFNILLTRLEDDVKQPFMVIFGAIALLFVVGFFFRYVKGLAIWL